MVHPTKSNRGFSRRRFIQISAAAGFTATRSSLAWGRSQPQLIRWRGIALGGEAELLISHPDEAHGRAILKQAEIELSRLEKIFSLYNPQSDLSVLNRTGELAAPPKEFVELLSTALSISSSTNGAFDPTVQPLWTLYSESFERTGLPPTAQEMSETLALVGAKGIDVSPNRINLPRQGMALTFNGIAQGFITDKIADLLRSAGLSNILVNMGEIRPIGRHPNGRPWHIKIESSKEPLQFSNADVAIATSAASGTSFDKNGAYGHLFNPTTGDTVADLRSVSVVAPSATLADGLSTALSVVPEQTWTQILSNFAGTGIRVFAERKDLSLFQSET